MPAAKWPLRNGRPFVQIELSMNDGGTILDRDLLADTGAGKRHSSFDLMLHKRDLSGMYASGQIKLGGAYPGTFPLYLVEVRIPLLNFSAFVPVVGVARTPKDFDGIAGMNFLSRFHFGNFDDPDGFGPDLLTTA